MAIIQARFFEYKMSLLSPYNIPWGVVGSLIDCEDYHSFLVDIVAGTLYVDNRNRCGGSTEDPLSLRSFGCIDSNLLGGEDEGRDQLFAELVLAKEDLGTRRSLGYTSPELEGRVQEFMYRLTPGALFAFSSNKGFKSSGRSGNVRSQFNQLPVFIKSARSVAISSPEYLMYDGNVMTMMSSQPLSGFMSHYYPTGWYGDAYENLTRRMATCSSSWAYPE